MMKFDKLKTERLIIRRLTGKDSETISLYRSIPEVAEFQSWDNYSLEESKKLINESLSSDPSIASMWFQFGIEELNSGKLIGDIGFFNQDEDGKCWIGFTIDSSYWRKGFGSEAVREIISYYQKIGISNVWASIDPRNISSQKLLEKLGFELIESKPDDLVFCRNL